MLIDDNFTRQVDIRRRAASQMQSEDVKSLYGQYMTPRHVAQFMASLFRLQGFSEIRLLDAGAGVGSLTAAFIQEVCNRQPHAQQIDATAYELDPFLLDFLQATLEECADACRLSATAFRWQVFNQDFISANVEQLADHLFGKPQRFTHAILNPPYKKIGSDSLHRRLLRSIGVETGNLYTAFLAVAIQLMMPGGELVAIVPRSFCNGTYFKPFRQFLLSHVAIQQVHVFESRRHAFKDEDVLQENIILHLVKGESPRSVILSSSVGIDVSHSNSRVVPFDQLVNPNDPEQMIHLRVDASDQAFVAQMQSMPCTLQDLNIDASTGPVVDFRLKEYLSAQATENTIPLLYPAHCQDGRVQWPLHGRKKPNALMRAPTVDKWLYPSGNYVLVRRFSAKEETRRVVASIYESTDTTSDVIGIENHLNVFHRRRTGLPLLLARGLAVYLNSTLVDVCFRQFSGHTQVNVQDLYALRYPDLRTLEALGNRVNNVQFPSQQQIDQWVSEFI